MELIGQQSFGFKLLITCQITSKDYKAGGAGQNGQDFRGQYATEKGRCQ